MRPIPHLQPKLVFPLLDHQGAVLHLNRMSAMAPRLYQQDLVQGPSPVYLQNLKRGSRSKHSYPHLVPSALALLHPIKFPRRVPRAWLAELKLSVSVTKQSLRENRCFFFFLWVPYHLLIPLLNAKGSDLSKKQKNDICVSSTGQISQDFVIPTPTATSITSPSQAYHGVE